MATKEFKPQNLQSLLGFILVAVILGGGALFYFGLETVRTYAVSVNERLEDADASDKQVEQLQVLKKQLAQSESLLGKANSTFTTPEAYQAQALLDVQRYASQVGITIVGSDFETPEGSGLHLIVLRVSNPTSYTKLTQFLTLVEGNLPKMQVNSIDLKHSPQGDGDSVDVSEIKINISVR